MSKQPSRLEVREMTLADVGLRIDYFHDADNAHLDRLGVDRALLPSRQEWHRLYEIDDARPLEQREFYSLLWLVDGKTMGFSSTDRIEFGRHAWMHLHITAPSLRRTGLGTQFVRLSAQRYFEMLGTIYWGGTYVFAGSPTAEGLIGELGRVRPTGLISVPVRWTQIREQCLERMDGDSDPAAEAAVFREVVGDRLRWGLSAAGYLDPLVFRFFQRNGVDLCSGFGMTEATGGITMTPPGSYVDGTVGIPLPGMRIRFGEHQELQIAGSCVAIPW